jgi:hypothetical protein
VEAAKTSGSAEKTWQSACHASTICDQSNATIARIDRRVRKRRWRKDFNIGRQYPPASVQILTRIKYFDRRCLGQFGIASSKETGTCSILSKVSWKLS